MAGNDEEKHMVQFERGPAKINLNTYVAVGGFLLTLIVMIFGGGAALSKIDTRITGNTTAIDTLRTRVGVVESLQRSVDNHELRLTSVEAQGRASAEGIRAVENSMNQLSSDIRVVREILQRLESKSDADRRGPP